MHDFCVALLVAIATFAQAALIMSVGWAVDCLLRRRGRSERERRAMSIAARHGLAEEVAHDIDFYGDDPAESLIEWDLDWRELDRDLDSKR